MVTPKSSSLEYIMLTENIGTKEKANNDLHREFVSRQFLWTSAKFYPNLHHGEKHSTAKGTNGKFTGKNNAVGFIAL